MQKDIIKMKTCTKCQQAKEPTKQFFYVHRNKTLRNECIKCISERSAYNYALRQERKRKVKELLPEWIDRPKIRIVVDVHERQQVIPNYPQGKSGTTELTISPSGTSESASNPEFVISNMQLVDYTPITGAVGELSMITASFIGGTYVRDITP